VADKKNSRLSAPILFAAPQLTVNSGNTAIADTGQLSTKYRRPFWLDEVRWGVTAVDDPATLSPSFAMQTRLRLGRFALSDRFIPLQNYAPLLNDFCESAYTTSMTAATYVAWIKWKLPKPLYVPAGMTLVSEFFRPAGKTPTSALVDVAYSARFIPKDAPVPEEVDVPWVTMFTPATGAVFGQSSELDLYNPFQVPLEVQRFLAANQDATVASAYLTVDQNLVTVMKDSAGTNIIRDFTATGSAFDINRRAWTFNKVLAPKERYNITLQALTGTLNNFNVSIVGSRKERI